MNTIIKFISDNDVMIMTALLILIIVLTIFVLIIDIINKKKNAKEADILFNKPDLNVINAFKETMNNEIPLEYTTDLSQFENAVKLPIEEEQQIKYVEEDEELEKTKAQLELKNLKEELIKAEQKEREEKLKERENTNVVENTTPVVNTKEETYEDKVDSFETAQEENAIISMDQFNMVSDKIYEQNEEVQYKDEGNEPISIKELEELYNTKELKAIPTDEEIINVTEIKQEEPKTDETPIVKTEQENNVDKKFKSSPVISPVYGTIEDDTVTSLALENTANLDKLSEEIKKTNEFLNLLKELRKNLQ